MKYLKFFSLLLVSLLAITVTKAQIKKIDIKSTFGPLMQYGHEAFLTTTDSVVRAIDSIVVTANEVGYIRATLVGIDNDATAGITGAKYVRYKKVAGTLTLGTVTDAAATVVDTEITGSTTWTIVASGNNIIVRVKGFLPLTAGINWKCRTEFISRTR